jgi:hypothetical protein
MGEIIRGVINSLNSTIASVKSLAEQAISIATGAVQKTGDAINGNFINGNNFIISSYQIGQLYLSDRVGNVAMQTSDSAAGSTGWCAINTTTHLFFLVQAPTASAPAYVKGGMYFDTTLNKLRIGGATGWETVTSV